MVLNDDVKESGIMNEKLPVLFPRVFYIGGKVYDLFWWVAFEIPRLDILLVSTCNCIFFKGQHGCGGQREGVSGIYNGVLE